MPQQPYYIESTCLFVMNGIFGQIQFVSSDRRVLIDLSADFYDADGYPQRAHAVASLAIDDVRRCRALLDQAIKAAESADPRQTGLCFDVADAAPTGQGEHNNLHAILKVTEMRPDPLAFRLHPLVMR